MELVNSKVDLGIFEVNRSCSNCCGVPYENVIDKLETISPLHFNGITGSGRAHTGDTVYYVGSKSGPSKGTVIADGHQSRSTLSNSLIADPRVAPNPSGLQRLIYGS